MIQNPQNKVTVNNEAEAKQITQLSRKAAICLVWLCVLMKCFYAFCDPHGTTSNLLGTLRPSLYTTHGLETQFSRNLVFCMRHGAACLTVLSYLVSFWPAILQEDSTPRPDVTQFSILNTKKTRGVQTNGPYLKRYRHGLRQLEHVQDNQRKHMKAVMVRRRKIWNRFNAIEKSCYKDIISKEELAGYLQTQLLPLEQTAMHAQQLVKVMREKLDYQRDENKNIQESLDKFANKSQTRQPQQQPSTL